MIVILTQFFWNRRKNGRTFHDVVYKTRSSVSGYRKSEEVQGLGIDAVDAVGCLDHDIMLVTNTNMNVVALHFSTFLSTKLI